MVDRVGQRLGKYRLIRLLGRGGFAEVYLGEHLRLSTQAAVKVLYTRLANPTEVECFEKEAHTIAHLSHPHIVRVFDFDVQDDTPFLVMDYATGGTLRQRHPKGSILPLPAIISYVKQVADALLYAHDQRLIHRDVKPENMLLAQRNEVLLSDFGIATIAHHTSTQSTQAMAGTSSIWLLSRYRASHGLPVTNMLWGSWCTNGSVGVAPSTEQRQKSRCSMFLLLFLLFERMGIRSHLMSSRLS